MDSIHDMGGMHGMGPIVAEEAEPVFHAEWEKRMFALNNAITAVGVRNLDESRHARERMNPAKYLSSSYYEIWLDGLIRILSEKDLISEEELSGAVASRPISTPRPAMKAEDVDVLMDKGGNYLAEDGKPARFNIGDTVKARNIHPAGHTRLPRYVRGHKGVIIQDYGLHVFPDANAHGRSDPQHLYSVKFASTELWGSEDGTDGDYIHVDLWDDYLEATGDAA
ncbi:MAG: nitrile hydratase subunit beta [Sneathiella sp.]